MSVVFGGVQTPPTGDEVIDRLQSERDAMAAALAADSAGPYQLNLNGWVRTVHRPSEVQRMIHEWDAKIEREYQMKTGVHPFWYGRVSI